MIQNTVENIAFSNISATTATFTLQGGQYGVLCVATFGGGNVQVQRLHTDGNYYSLQGFTSTAFAVPVLPQGTYRVGVTTATAAYITITAIPVR